MRDDKQVIGKTLPVERRASAEPGGHAGITWRSLAVILASLLIVAMIIQFMDIIETPRSRHYLTSHVLALPAVMAFGAIVAIAAFVFLLTKQRILKRAEMFCIFFALLIACPLMAAGFWHGMVKMTATLPRTASFEKMDALPDNLWPHGRNLVEGALSYENKDDLIPIGNVSWPQVKYAEDKEAPLVTVNNESEDGYSGVRLKVPIEKDGKPVLLLNEPYLISALVRGEDLGPGANYFCRLYYDDNDTFAEEIFAAAEPSEVDYLHKEGFLRLGAYGTVIPTTVDEHIYLEFGLSGQGTVTFRDVRMMSVGGLENLLRGRRIISQSEFEELPESHKRGARPGNTGIVVRPDNMLSLDGLKFLLSGYIPWHHWGTMAATWGSYAALLLLATLAVAVIMRRQWVDNERYPMPVAQITQSLIGRETGTESPFSGIWRNRMMWLGFGLAMFWCVMRGWQQYNPELPNMGIGFPVKPYLSGPKWGQTWTEVHYGFTAMLVSVAMFMELNVLISIVIGYFLFRLQFWFGYNYLAMGKSVGGWYGQTTYPFGPQQIVGSYVTYGLLILFFTRKYLWHVLKLAITGKSPKSKAGDDESPQARSAEPELFSYRTAFLLLLATLAGVILWSRWVGIPAAGMLVYFLFLLLVGFVAAKIRAECGTPFAAYFPHKAVLATSLVGGMSLFAPQGIVFITLTMSVFMPLFVPAVFFLIPGLQVELIELGRRYKLPRSHILYTALIGIAGGIVIGGWVFLSSTYGMGADNVGEQQAFRSDRQLFETYSKQLTDSTQEMIAEQTGVPAAPRSIEPETWAYAYGAATTALVTILRQMFAGFWFHPIGIILGPTSMAQWVWGAALTAWIIRSVTLKLGGAVTVRTKLLPFFVGVFLAGVSTHVLFGIINAILYFFAPGVMRQGGVF